MREAAPGALDKPHDNRRLYVEEKQEAARLPDITPEQQTGLPPATGVAALRVTEKVMPKLVEYQDGEVDVKSRNPLRGTLALVDDEDNDVDLELDKDSAEELVSVLMQFLMQGEGGDMPKISIGHR
ncbi:hypothetical protein [Mesorhizobium sp.]|uniref:hypothetical protein n=1 Tax=Mesorhizobium sp. TaxID=1871066 RepID=UPI0025C6FD27|nr:hypothetical protein [Mesorhizobium sp.]